MGRTKKQHQELSRQATAQKHSQSVKSDSKHSSSSEEDDEELPLSEPVKDLIMRTVQKEIQSLSSSLEMCVEQNNDLKQNVEMLEKRLSVTEGLLIQAQVKINQQNETILDLQTRSMRDNLIIRGIAEGDRESWDETRNKVVAFMKTELGIADASTDMIDRAHRTGSKLAGKSRNVVAKFKSSEAKGKIFKNIRKLAGKSYGIQEQLPTTIQERRNRLFPRFKEAKQRAKQDDTVKVSWSYDKLNINGKLYSAKDDVQYINPSEHGSLKVHITHSQQTTDHGSTFQGHAAKLSPDVSVSTVLANLLTNRAIAQAEHNIYAYRLSNGSEGCSDDGEHSAGTKLLALLRDDHQTDVMIIVTRWFGGTHIGPKRYDHLKNTATEALKILRAENI